MKVKIFCDNHANISSHRSDTVDTEDLGFTEEEWKALTKDEQFEAVYNFIMDSGWVETWYEEEGG